MKKAERQRPVLILGSDRSKKFLQTLLGLSLSPTFFKSMEALLDALRRTPAAAILVDRDQRKEDELELVLNVRDMHESIPIILIGLSSDERTDRILKAQPATLLIKEAIGGSSLGQQLRALAAD